MPIASRPSPDLRKCPAHPLQVLEERRLRGLLELRDLEAVRLQRPLLGFEERALRRSQSLVQEMDARIRELLNAPAVASEANVLEGGSAQHGVGRRPDPAPALPPCRTTP